MIEFNPKRTMGWVANKSAIFLTHLLFLIGPAVAFEPYDRAKEHPIVFDRPAVDFFEGALLGNGGLGVVVNTRPDAIQFRFGHNNVWDIRLDERHKDEVGSFQELFDHVLAMPESLDTVDE
ncbi:MAG: hypothetical protein KC940_24275, partial [Candidatus Omnitrophica bacterium]|nr:hypothetical protein [Candidatus Omnitrophota bacterium]